jgi:hypothetical protein
VWTNAPGVNTVSVGASSTDLPLTGQVSIGGGVVTPPPTTNLAQGKPVAATGSVGGFPPGTRRRKHRQLLGKHEQRVPEVS